MWGRLSSDKRGMLGLRGRAEPALFRSTGSLAGCMQAWHGLWAPGTGHFCFTLLCALFFYTSVSKGSSGERQSSSGSAGSTTRPRSIPGPSQCGAGVQAGLGQPAAAFKAAPHQPGTHSDGAQSEECSYCRAANQAQFLLCWVQVSAHTTTQPEESPSEQTHAGTWHGSCSCRECRGSQPAQHGERKTNTLIPITVQS